MNLKIISIFFLAIFIPTSLLAYFGILAVRSEKDVVERNMVQKYKAMADIVEGQIKEVLSRAADEDLADTSYWESLLAAQAAIFKDEVAVFSRTGRRLSAGQAGLETAAAPLSEAVFSRPLAGLPYMIAVYERYPLILEQLEQRRRGLVLYIGLIAFSAFSILAGSFYALSALAREWRFARLKSEFVAHLSHDLRRPLTSIQMFSEMLKEGHIPSEEKKQEYYNIIANESDKLTHLANNVLDFSRVERGRIRYHFEPMDITSIVRDTVERFKTYMLDDKRSVSLEMDPCPPVRVDVHTMTQAVMNLLTNAAKYSPAGTPIEVKVGAGLKPTRTVSIDVIDHGYGVPTSEHKKIFRKFYRVSKPYVSQIEGSGLGLTLVQYTVEAHGGKVLVESKEGKGSKFSIVLPV